MHFFYARLFTPQQTEGLPTDEEIDRAIFDLTPGRGLETYDEFLLLRVLLRDFLEAAATQIGSACLGAAPPPPSSPPSQPPAEPAPPAEPGAPSGTAGAPASPTNTPNLLRQKINLLRIVVRTVSLMTSLQLTQKKIFLSLQISEWRQRWQYSCSRPLPAYLRGG